MKDFDFTYILPGGAVLYGRAWYDPIDGPERFQEWECYLTEENRDDDEGRVYEDLIDKIPLLRESVVETIIEEAINLRANEVDGLDAMTYAKYQGERVS